MKKAINNCCIYKLFNISLALSVFLVTSSWADPVVKRNRSVDRFTGINVGGAFNIVLKQTGGYNLVVEAEEDVHDEIETEVKGGTLYIKMDWSWRDRDHGNITIYIDFDELNMLHVSGAADVKGESLLKLEDLALEVTGAGDLDLEVEARSLDVKVSGAGDIRISGHTDEQQVRLSGAGDYKAGDLKSNYTHAKVSGAGTVIVYASREIEAYASGAGSVKYYGNPAKEKTSSTGAGSISKRTN